MSASQQKKGDSKPNWILLQSPDDWEQVACEAIDIGQASGGEISSGTNKGRRSFIVRLSVDDIKES